MDHHMDENNNNFKHQGNTVGVLIANSDLGQAFKVES